MERIAVRPQSTLRTTPTHCTLPATMDQGKSINHLLQPRPQLATLYCEYHMTITDRVKYHDLWTYKCRIHIFGVLADTQYALE